MSVEGTSSGTVPEWSVCTDVENFLQHRKEAICASESLYCLTWAGIKRARQAAACRSGSTTETDTLFFVCRLSNNQLVAHAIFTKSSQSLLVSEVTEEQASALATFLASQSYNLRKAEVSIDAVAAFTQAYCEATGALHKVEINQGLYEVSEVRMPDLDGGKLLVATEGHKEIVCNFFMGFFCDAFPQRDPPNREQMESKVQKKLSCGQVYLWQRGDGDIVSMACVVRESPKTSSISIVYTPLKERKQGYAARVVASLSQARLDAGKTACNLHTDLANATSNHVYVKVGYTLIWKFSKIQFTHTSD